MGIWVCGREFTDEVLEKIRQVVAQERELT